MIHILGDSDALSDVIDSSQGLTLSHFVLLSDYQATDTVESIKQKHFHRVKNRSRIYSTLPDTMVIALDDFTAHSFLLLSAHLQAISGDADDTPFGGVIMTIVGNYNASVCESDLYKSIAWKRVWLQAPRTTQPELAEARLKARTESTLVKSHIGFDRLNTEAIVFDIVSSRERVDEINASEQNRDNDQVMFCSQYYDGYLNIHAGSAGRWVSEGKKHGVIVPPGLVPVPKETSLNLCRSTVAIEFGQLKDLQDSQKGLIMLVAHVDSPGQLSRVLSSIKSLDHVQIICNNPVLTISKKAARFNRNDHHQAILDVCTDSLQFCEVADCSNMFGILKKFLDIHTGPPNVL